MLLHARRALTANSLQLLLNQALSLSVFLLLARHLDKAAFGLLNGLLALLLLVFGVLSFGIDQLLVRKAANGEDPATLLGMGLVHNFLAATLLYLCLLSASFFSRELPLQALLFLCAGKGLLFLGQVFKSVVAGQERFRRLLAMSLAANLGKAIGLWMLVQQGPLALRDVVLVFFLSDALEAVTCLLLAGAPIRLPFKSIRARYRSLLLESLPQLGTVLFAAALARFDWLFLAFASNASELAEYSFAYKSFELAQLPLLVIAPLLVPRFTRFLRSGQGRGELKQLLRTEAVLALLTVLVLNTAWTPVADWVSDGKYGAACRTTVLLLSLAIPVLYYNNYLWSLLFAEGRTKLIFRIFAATFFVNVMGNLVLVPTLQKEGAALAFGVSLLVQTFLYHYYTHPGWRLRLRRSPEATGTS
ncbi:MAG: hypothetical protein EOO15_11800 [Chitinophagaceae bacterium]|nr:MAG: hypothetical protein EOO15_11800 [Chitinophagaceae bacterium]